MNVIAVFGTSVPHLHIGMRATCMTGGGPQDHTGVRLAEQRLGAEGSSAIPPPARYSAANNWRGLKKD